MTWYVKWLNKYPAAWAPSQFSCPCPSRAYALALARAQHELLGVVPHVTTDRDRVLPVG